MTLLWVLVVLGVPVSLAALHPTSPCSSIFTYEGSQPEHERWYGVILLSTDESLVGVRIDIKLDRPAEILVSWMGKVTTNDNELFTVLNLEQKLYPGPPVPSRFMVKFNAVKGSPQVRTIRLNGRQICPPDPNLPTDTQHGNQDSLYDNKYTTERVTRRPDLEFNDDWADPKPATTSRYPSAGDSYKPPVRQNPSGYSSHEQGEGYNSYSNTHSHTDTDTYNQEQSGNSGYGNTQGSSSGGGYNSHRDQDKVRTTTHDYDSHETYNTNQKPSDSGGSNTYSNFTRPLSESHQSSPNNLRPLLTQNTDYIPQRPSISININKDVTYNVDMPDAMNYNPETSGPNRPSSNRETPNVNSQYPKTTERYNSHNSGGGGIRDDTYSKPKITTTTKKPVVINSIHINIHSSDSETPSQVSSYTPSQPKPTTRRPQTSSNKNSSSSSSSRQTTRRPSSSVTQRPSSSHGYQSSSPNKYPDISSSETHYQSSYGQNNYNEETTTVKNHYSNNQEPSNHRPSSSEFAENSRPNPIPSNRPSGDGGNKKIPKPQTMGSKQGDQSNLESSNSNVKCGSVVVNPTATPLITHGQNTARGQWPWHIALYRIEGINLSYSCGGSLVSSSAVITAAHCVTKAPRDRPVDADILVVQLGKYHLYQFSDDSVQNKQVQNIYVHPRYNSTNYLDDLAVLILSSPAEFTKYVRPVCLWPKHNFNLQNIDNKEGTVVGWGYDENNQVTEELKMARMPVVSYVTCLKSYPQFFSQFTSENKTFCAGFRQGTSVCNGDSGGGMVFQHNNVWYLRGLVSITVAKQGLRVCDTSHYVVFTDIANYIDWVNRYIS